MIPGVEFFSAQFFAIAFLSYGTVLFCYARGLRYLQALQQDEYSPTRFGTWYRARRAWDTRAIPVFLGLLILWWFLSGAMLLWSILGMFSLISLSMLEPSPTAFGKVRLIMTERARTIWVVSCVLWVLAWMMAHLVLCMSGYDFLGTILVLMILVQALPLFLVCAVALLRPFELRKQKNLEREAYEHFQRLVPFSIGVTGSYGKTSVKHYLGAILQVARGNVFWPEKGINTLMGVVREIRTKLRIEHRTAIIEMAAYRKGSIARLCELTSPTVGIITAIGVMHLERFGSEEAIYQAKTELARAVPPDGILICNGDWPNCRRAVQEYAKATTILYGLDRSKGHLDVWMEDVALSAEGTKFKIVWNGERYEGFTPLMGKPALSNLLASFTAACTIGCNPELVLSVAATLVPPDNRLSIKRNKQSIYLMDAYNSNPTGFESALEVLRDLPSKRKLLMTPGMIELGPLQYDENRRLAQLAAPIVDLVLLIGATNAPAIKDGLKSVGFDEDKILCFETRDPALQYLNQFEEEGDVVLIENDLSDWYEDTTPF
jgi:UDP-N-acetylmuramoyl-tripeptide--D-alanyl-D-alanine ligase